MIAKKSWMRVTALVLAMLVAYAPSAFAGRLLDSALAAAAEVTPRQAPLPDRDSPMTGASVRGAAEARTAAVQAPPEQVDRGRGSGRMWALIGAGVALGLIMMKIDRTVEDSTPSTRRERRDGCKLFCS